MNRVKHFQNHLVGNDEGYDDKGLDMQHVSSSSGGKVIDDSKMIAKSFADVGKNNDKSIKDQVSPEEWKVRCDLAAAYRIAAYHGWDDSINNHFTVKYV